MLPVAVFCFAFAAVVALTPLVGSLARRAGVMDVPGASMRKRHRTSVPLWGGIGIYAAFAGVVLLLAWTRTLPLVLVGHEAVAGLLIGGAILVLGGLLDERFDLPPRIQILFPLAAVTIAVISGISIDAVRNPFGGIIPLDLWNVPLGDPFGFPIVLSLPADALVFLWILGMTYTTKVLDGLDGLVAGLAVIATLLIYAVALRPELDQPDVAVLAAAAAGAFGGFLVWNWHPARMFLGESGSTLAGFLIGALAVISGSKVATTLLVLGAPILDLGIVVIGRYREGRRIVSGDLTHLHFRLLALGISERSAVLTLYLTALAFGSIGLIASTRGKAAAFLILAALFTLASRALRRIQRP